MDSRIAELEAQLTKLNLDLFNEFNDANKKLATSEELLEIAENRDLIIHLLRAIHAYKFTKKS